MKPKFIDILSTAQYALLPLINHAQALTLSRTCRAARGIISPMLWLCGRHGHLKWISGHEASFLDGDLQRAKYSDLSGMSLSKDGSILLSDSHNNVLRCLEKDRSSILTSRVDGPRGMCVDDNLIYAACDRGVCIVSLDQPEHWTILRHLPRLIIELPGPLAPFHVSKVNERIYITDFSSTLYCWNGALEKQDFPGSLLAGMCRDGNALLVCDYAKGQVLKLEGGIRTIVYEYPHVRCIVKHHNTLFISSDSELIEVQPRKVIIQDLDIGIKALAVTKQGTPIVANFSQVFAVL